MITNESTSISRSSTANQVKVRDSQLICVNCNTTAALDDLFCQECGATLAIARDDNENHEDAFEQGSISNVDKILALRNFEYTASIKRFAVLTAVIAVVGLSVFAVLAIAGSYDAMSEDYICDHAKKLIVDNDTVQAAEILQRLYLARAQKLKPQTLELLGQALVKRSELYAGRNQIEQAVKDLKDVPPGTAQSVTAAEKLSSLIPKAVPAVIAQEAAQPAVSEPVVAKIKALPAPSLEPVAKKTVAPSKPAFTANDVTNYNRLLAGYFEKSGAESEPSSDLGSTEETSKTVKPVSEPPTLKEWVDAGRPDF
ncbi:MAG: hypothetical protein P4L53_29040 [Candidatus Obscuribacterales bacterium]|nr:hypothetical protein [Candidatus Obscuribacterales bacterium]